MAGRARYVIIGDGAAGITAAQTLRALDPTSQITLVSDDPHPAYYRAALTNYLMGELRDEQIWAVPPSFFADLALERVHGRVAQVDTQRGSVWLQAGQQLPYDALLVGSGARARPASFEGASLAGVAVLRTLQDTRWVMDSIRLYGLQRAVVVGGGPLALEWALAMRERGVKVTMLVRERTMMPGALDEVASDLLFARLRQGGLDVRLGEEVAAAVGSAEGRVAAVRTRSGETIPCEMVAMAIGVIPNVEFLQGSGVALGKRGGIAVDDRLRSSVPNVYAAGDVAELDGKVVQLWEPARLQAKVAATNMVGRDHVYVPGVQYFATRLFDLDFASLGTIARDPTAIELVDAPRGGGKIAYRRLVIKNGRLVGALMLGDRAARVRAHGRLFKRLIDEQVDVSALSDQLLDPAFDLAGWLGSRALLEKPKDAPAIDGTQPVNAAQLRGTQFVRLGAGPAAASPHTARAQILHEGSAPVVAAAAAVAPPPRGTLMMSPQAYAAAAAVPPPAPGQTIMALGLRGPPSTGPVPRSAPVQVRTAWLEGPGVRFEIRGAVCGIGRDPTLPIALQDPGASHLHAQITAHGETLFLRDLGSRNGTWVNGQQVTVPHLLRDGDKLHIGTSDLVFRTSDASLPPPVPVMPRAVAMTPEIAAAGPRGAPASGPAFLEGRSGAFAGVRHALSTSPSTIGRDVTSTIRIDDLTISRRHAVLTQHGNGWTLSDLHSSAGTTVNGVKLTGGVEQPLNDGDVVTFGTVVIAFRRG